MALFTSGLKTKTLPELPEVETVVRGLAAVVPGRRIVAVEGVAPVEIVGQSIRAVRRYGKFIVMELDTGLLIVHLGMTGQLLLSAAEGKFTRARVLMDEGVLRYDDIRKFGKIYFSTRYPERGPEPLEIAVEEFVERARRRRTRIKALLLDQGFVRGMGNIYTDEALFRAGIHPLTLSARLSRTRLRSLHAAMQELLREAIEAGGSSISDYVGANGEKGSFQERHQVYGRKGMPCVRCETPLERILVVQRGTSFCPKCQRM